MRDDDTILKTLGDIIDQEPSEDEGDETQHDVSLRSMKDADISDIILSFMKPNFKLIYKNSIGNIKSMELLDKQELCLRLMDIITKEFLFQFDTNVELFDDNDINDFFKFVEFLKFDNLYFIEGVWDNHNINDITGFTNGNIDKIDILIDTVDKLSIDLKHEKFIYKFLTSCSKYGILKLVLLSTKMYITELKINKLKGE